MASRKCDVGRTFSLSDSDTLIHHFLLCLGWLSNKISRPYCFQLISSFLCSTAIPLSDDHKPNRSDERRRIENAGGVVMWAGLAILAYL